MHIGIKATLYKTGKEFHIYDDVGSYAENVMLSLGFGCSDYWFTTFEYDFCKKPLGKIKGKNPNE